MGTQKLLRSLDRGNHFEEISGDLTSNHKPTGNVPYSTITTIDESPLKFGLIWVGTDDGNVWITKDGGGNWQKVSGSLPSKLWISKVTASQFDKNTAFVSLSGYRDDRFQSYIYKTTNYGKTWTSISGNLPGENVNVILQDPVNPDLLFAGTDGGAYLSLDDGQNWQNFAPNFPNVPTHDMVIQQRDSMLAIGTHGRSTWVVNIAPFEKMTPDKLTRPIVVFQPDKVVYNSDWAKKRYPYLDAKEPNARFLYYVGKNSKDASKINIDMQDSKGNTIQTFTGPASVGFHTLTWNLKVKEQYASDKKYPFAETGSYTVYFSNGNSRSMTVLKIVKPDQQHDSEDIPGQED